MEFLFRNALLCAVLVGALGCEAHAEADFLVEIHGTPTGQAVTVYMSEVTKSVNNLHEGVRSSPEIPVTGAAIDYTAGFFISDRAPGRLVWVGVTVRDMPSRCYGGMFDTGEQRRIVVNLSGTTLTTEPPGQLTVEPCPG